MAQCASWQAPFSVYNISSDSASDLCNTLAHNNNFSDFIFSGSFQNGICTITLNGDPSNVNTLPIDRVCDAPDLSSQSQNVINCGAACSVQVELKAAPAEASHIQDMSMLWGAFLVVLVVVYCGKQMLRFFESAPHGEN